MAKQARIRPSWKKSSRARRLRRIVRESKLAANEFGGFLLRYGKKPKLSFFHAYPVHAHHRIDRITKCLKCTFALYPQLPFAVTT